MLQPLILFIFDSPVQIAVVVGIVVLLFGAGRLPQLAKSLGQSRKAFKEGMREAEMDDAAPAQISQSAAAPSISNMSDDELMAEMRRRVEEKQP